MLETAPANSSSGSCQVRSLSLRDPAGQLFDVDGRLIRILRKTGLASPKAFLESKTVMRWISEGRFVRLSPLESSDAEAFINTVADNLFFPVSDADIAVESLRLPFVSYPSEWPSEMLFEAGMLTLDLAEALLAEGLGLKDASAHNVLFDGPKAVFVDLLSIESRNPKDAVWLAYGQFARNFLNPILAQQYFGLSPHATFGVYRDGLWPKDLYAMCSFVQRWFPPFLTQATIPFVLGGGEKASGVAKYQARLETSAEKSHFILSALFSRLRSAMKRASSRMNAKKSFWSQYTAEHLPYDPDQFDEKKVFVEDVLRQFNPTMVLDVGCNTGEFSRLAANLGSKVVAIDTDAVAVGKTWQMAKRESLDILPLVVDLSSPTPAAGWLNRERTSFLERSKNTFDVVLMLAVAHHMIITDGLPIAEVFEAASLLTKDILVVEFVSPHDPMFQALAKGRYFPDYNQAHFEQCLSKRFSILKKCEVSNSGRTLYSLRKRA